VIDVDVPPAPVRRLAGRVAIIFGAGQTPGRTVGNGKATALIFAREGAKVVAVDRDLAAAQDTVDAITALGEEGMAVAADVLEEDQVQAAVQACLDTHGRIDILHNNVGVSIAAGDAPVTEISVEAFDLVYQINLRGMVLAAKHVLPTMRRQGSGVIINISSAAAFNNAPYVGYKTSKAAVVALTTHLALRNAAYGIRANVILPGQIETPMGVENRARKSGLTYEETVAMRNQSVLLGQQMGTAWDVANAALFLVSDEAKYITGISLPVDGGQSAQAGRPPSAAEMQEAQEEAARVRAERSPV
jgi:NAD(P)-dependent dehydrogenase (short-subunit alcohol dehydrogenase family)